MARIVRIRAPPEGMRCCRATTKGCSRQNDPGLGDEGEELPGVAASGAGERVDLVGAVEMDEVLVGLGDMDEHTRQRALTVTVGIPLSVTTTASLDAIVSGEHSQLHAMANGGAGGYTCEWFLAP